MRAGSGFRNPHPRAGWPRSFRLPLLHSGRCRLCLPDVRLPLGLIAPQDKALAKFKIFCVFIVLAFALPYRQQMFYLFEFLFSVRCASRGMNARRFNGNEL